MRRRLWFFLPVGLLMVIAIGWLLGGIGEPSAREELALVERMEEAERDFQEGRFASIAPNRRLSGYIALENGTHLSITPPLPSKLTFTTTLPRDAVLDFSAGLETRREVWRAKVAFQVTVDTDSSREVVFREVFRSYQHNRWHRRRADLNRWSGKAVRITLAVEPAYGHRPPAWADRVRSAWGHPVISGRSPGGWLQAAAAWLRGGSGEDSSRNDGIDGGGRISIILVLVDALRADYLGSYGFDADISPHLDRLAAESIRFENCISQAPWTKPSIASLFTSLHPEVHGVTNHEGMFWGDWTPGLEVGKLPEQAVTLAELLREAGYRTGAFIANPLLAPVYGFDQGFDSYEVYEVEDLSHIITAAAKHWMQSGPSERPFFAYLHFMNVHGPYLAPETDYQAVRSSESLGADRRLSDREYQAITDYLKRAPWVEEPDRRQLKTWRARYAAGVREFDRSFFPFLEAIQRSGLLDRTLLLFTSDHGEELGEHGGWDHGHSLYEHQLRVPLLVRLPGGKNGGEEVPNVVSLIDLMPTILAQAGIEPPDGLQGRDLSSLLENDSSGHDPGISFSTATSDRPGLHVVRTARYKLILDMDDGETLLFQVMGDLKEQQNLASRQPQEAARLRERLEAHLDQMASRGTLDTETAPITEELSERLRKLGYLR